MIRVSVGPKRKIYNIHEDILTTACPWILETFCEWNRRGRSGESLVTLADGNPATFDLFVEWIYRDTVPNIDEGTGDSSAVVDFAEAWEFAHELGMYAFKNALIGRIREYHMSQPIDLELFRFYDKCGPQDNQLQRYISDQAVYDYLICRAGDRLVQKLEGTVKKGGEEAACLVQAMRSPQVMEGSNVRNPAELRGCRHHEHPFKSPACRPANWGEPGRRPNRIHVR